MKLIVVIIVLGMQGIIHNKEYSMKCKWKTTIFLYLTLICLLFSIFPVVKSAEVPLSEGSFSTSVTVESESPLMIADNNGSFITSVNVQGLVWTNWSSWWYFVLVPIFDPPSSFVATGYNISVINLTWSVVSNATHTYIQRKESGYPTSRTDGTFVCNVTDEYFNDTGLSLGTRYYYSAWGYNESNNAFTSSYSTATDFTGPGDPSNFVVTENLSFSIALSWSKGNNATNTVIVMKEGSYPTSLSDGTIKYNSTGTSTTVSGLTSNITYYFSAWSYLSGVFSEGYVSVDGTTTSYGALQIWAYNESNPHIGLLNFTVFMKNEDGSQTYENSSCNNPHNINLSSGDLPLGEDVIVQVSKAGYHTRIQYMDIYADHSYNISFYLPPDIGGGGDPTEPDYIPPDAPNITYASHYIIIVKDEIGNELEGVKVVIERYINTTGQYEDIYVLYTDGYGTVGVDLIPNIVYQITISKTGYATATYNLLPIPIIDVEDRYHTYTLFYSRDEEPILIPQDVIDFTASINSDGNITVNYYDNLENTTNTQIRIYQYYNYTLTLNNTNSRTGDYNFSWTTTGYNISMVHKIILWVNHSNFDDMITMEIQLMPIVDVVDESTIEERFTGVFGDWDLGYVKTFLIFLPCVFFLLVCGSSNIGVGILSSGLYLSFTTALLGVAEHTSYISIGMVLAVVGFLIIIVKRGRERI